ncbi:MAG: class I SAM-dependent rRNA methyltransferase [Planctomycetota bacterium]|jgi:23S rRNA (cytosine1962-C5)-methyltransferase
MPDVVLRGGPPAHPYVYSKRVMRVDRAARDGEVVRILTREGRPCGYGFFHGRSLITLRVLTYDPDVAPDEAWLRERVRAADALRRDVLRLPEQGNAWRVLHAEGDGVPGLVVDRYGPVAVASLFSLGWQRRRGELERALMEETGCDDVVFRADARVAAQEGIDLPAPAPRPLLEIKENGVAFGVDASGGHKTGFFLDQRENRRRLADMARGRTVFDGMTYTGGFALAAARGGARAVRAMDLDEEALALARANAVRNDVAVAFEHGDVFDALRAYAAAGPADRPEVLVVDPPKWARDRAGLAAALTRYRDLNRLALQAVKPGGLVVTNSCSGLVSESALLGVIRDAARDTRREVRFLTVAGAAPDHPVSAVFPEGRYLKSAFLTVGPDGSGPGGGAPRERAGRGRKRS